MRRRLELVLALAVLLGLAGSRGFEAAARADPEAPKALPALPPLPKLLELYKTRDYFALRNELGGVPDVAPSGDAQMGFLVAALQHAFNRPDKSNLTLRGLASVDLPAELRGETRRLRMANYLRRHNYRFALAAAREIVAAPAGEHPRRLVQDVRNTSLLLEALEAVPPQTVEVRKSARLKMRLGRRVPVQIDGERITLALDSGANFSVLKKSEAQRLGLAIRPVGLAVGTSTGLQVTADLAVADRVELGPVVYRNVVFLVFPDSVLKFPDGTSIPGLIGFPLLEAAGEVRFWRDGTVEIPATPTRRKGSNLALDDLEPLISVRYAGEEIVCRLDTGAQRTFFYSTFYERFKSRVESSGAPRSIEVGGVGGIRRINAYQMPSISLEVARATVRVKSPDIYAAALDSDVPERLACNLGLDSLERFRYYAINFRDMALVLGS